MWIDGWCSWQVYSNVRRWTPGEPLRLGPGVSRWPRQPTSLACLRLLDNQSGTSVTTRHAFALRMFHYAPRRLGDRLLNLIGNSVGK